MAQDRFDNEAAQWDSNPTTVRSSKLAYGALLEHVPQLQSSNGGKTELEVLEVGCGTGLLSLLVAPKVRSLTAVDTSSGMISALQAKLKVQSEVSNIKPVCALLEDADDARIRDSSAPDVPKRFDLVISHLVLHHIPSLSDILRTMYGTLKPGGQVALTDFENFGPEARKFHPESKMEGVERHGIERSEMEKILKDAGLVDVKVETAFKLDKEVEGGDKTEFPFLICLGKKAA